MQTTFTTRRALHQNVTGAEVTGEVPTAMWLHAKPSDEASGYADQKFGWIGCLDAPDMLPAGSTLPVNIPEDIGGMGYEGNVARIVYRDGVKV